MAQKRATAQDILAAKTPKPVDTLYGYAVGLRPLPVGFLMRAHAAGAKLQSDPEMQVAYNRETVARSVVLEDTYTAATPLLAPELLAELEGDTPAWLDLLAKIGDLNNVDKKAQERTAADFREGAAGAGAEPAGS